VHVNEIKQMLGDLYIVKMCTELQLEFWNCTGTECSYLPSKVQTYQMS